MRRDREGEKGREREGERERERQRLLALQRSDGASAGQMSFIPRATEQLDGVQQRIRALEDMLSNTREALQQGREALTYRDAEGGGGGDGGDERQGRVEGAGRLLLVSGLEAVSVADVISWLEEEAVRVDWPPADFSSIGHSNGRRLPAWRAVRTGVEGGDSCE